MMNVQIRFLLTNKCTARCEYCHNEGQSKAGNLLSVEAIRHVLNTLEKHGCTPSEIVLSGGEPTLHKQLAEIAQICHATGAHISMDSHGGHPELFKKALPFLHELKVHIDSFDPLIQQKSMGIDIENVRRTVRLAQQSGIHVQANHPLQDLAQTVDFIQHARLEGLDCKIIEVFNENTAGPADACSVLGVHQQDWSAYGYQREGDFWRHQNGRHRLFGRQCAQRTAHHHTLFIGADGIRRQLNHPALTPHPEMFSIQMLRGH